MKFVNKLLGRSDEPPKWDIKPPAERPAARKKVEAFEEPLPSQQPQVKDPFLDDELLDNIQLEDDISPEDNPYQTHTWEQDLENDTRKLKTIQIGEATEQQAESKFNPYDTGAMRRGWKK